MGHLPALTDGVNKSPKQNPVLAFLNYRKYSYLKIFQNPTQFSFSNRVTVFNVILYMFHSLQPVFLSYNHTSAYITVFDFLSTYLGWKFS